MGNLRHWLSLGGGGSSLVERARATWKHLGAPGAGVVSGVNAASAAASDGWLGSPNKSAPLPGKMEREEGWRYKGDHSSLVTTLPLFFFKRFTVQSTHLNQADTHNTHFLSFFCTTPDHASPRDTGHFYLTLKKDIRGERDREGRKWGVKERREKDSQKGAPLYRKSD